MAGQPKLPFYLALVVVVGGLIWFAVSRSDLLAPKGGLDGGAAGDAIKAPDVEAPDAASVTTVKEYTFTPAQRLPEVKGTAAYKPLVDDTVRFALNVWAGWGPIILANDGFKAGKAWKTAGREGLQGRAGSHRQPRRHARRVRLRRHPHRLGDARHGAALPGGLRRRDGEAKGQPGHAPHLPAGGLVERRRRYRGPGGRSRPSPTCAGRSWFWRRTRRPTTSRSTCSSRAESSRPRSQMVYTEDAFQAAAAFNAADGDRRGRIVGPRHLQPREGPGEPMLVTTATANKLIADVWFARADFAHGAPRYHRGPRPRASSTPWRT